MLDTFLHNFKVITVETICLLYIQSWIRNWAESFREANFTLHFSSTCTCPWGAQDVRHVTSTPSHVKHVTYMQAVLECPDLAPPATCPHPRVMWQTRCQRQCPQLTSTINVTRRGFHSFILRYKTHSWFYNILSKRLHANEKLFYSECDRVGVVRGGRFIVIGIILDSWCQLL